MSERNNWWDFFPLSTWNLTQSLADGTTWELDPLWWDAWQFALRFYSHLIWNELGIPQNYWFVRLSRVVGIKSRRRYNLARIRPSEHAILSKGLRAEQKWWGMPPWSFCQDLRLATTINRSELQLELDHLTPFPYATSLSVSKAWTQNASFVSGFFRSCKDVAPLSPCGQWRCHSVIV
jgi:hypothetical protein